MCSEKQRELYTQFEPDANEILFGQRTSPNRPLTDQELSKRRKIVLKLVDQKLKFELIELLRKQQEQTYEIHNNSTSSIASDPDGWAAPAIYYGCQDVDQQTEFENAWNSDGSYQIPEQNQNPTGVSTFYCEQQPHINRGQLNSNLIELSPKIPSTYRSQFNSNLIEIPVQKFQKTETKISSTTSIANIRGINVPAKDSSEVISEAEAKASSLPSGAYALPSTRKLKDQKTSLPTDNSKNTRRPQERKTPSATLPTPTIEKPTVIFGGELVGNKSTKFFDKPKTLLLHNTLKRKQGDGSTDFPTRMLVMNEASAKNTIHRSSNHSGAGNIDSAAKTPSNTVETDNTIDLTIDYDIGESFIAETNIRSESAEWIAMDQLVADLFQNKSNNWKALSASDFELKNEILIQTAINPDVLRSHPKAQTVRQRVGDRKFEELIKQSSIILSNLSRTDPENQASFSKSQKLLVKNLKKGIANPETVSETKTFRGPHTKIANLISPFLCPGDNIHDLTLELVKNPYALLSNTGVKNRIVGKGQLVSNIMRNIKIALEQFIPVRLPKKFSVPSDRFIDVPFVVKLFNRYTKMTSKSATDLTKVLIESINCMKIQKPALRDIKFKDGALEILCINTMSFDWLKNTLSHHLGVEIRPVNNAIGYDQLKTICLKFHVPQYFHFNNLMEQLRVNNPRLLTRRWELRSPRSNKVVDSTKCVYVGVDVDSLIILEEMNRVGTLRDSSVYFEISYEDSEENFKKMTFEKKKKQPKHISKIK
ncbi:uncharacterized protein LOC119077858 [Bradysia coprophila]|uniref:uncharacterized protein LOC119077858 n=1 Tax=Bradysia coprophila TaxID=38358 RepID=UPI00187D885A|nr:uncharacterized protein LOC119077858 [Bradysia coprophila]